MIAALKGILDTIDTPYIILDVNGVGYRVLVSNNLLSSLTLGQTIKIFTYTHVREDLLELYGFSNLSDLKLFEKLISVSGIGPKTAVGIFAIGTGSEIIDAIYRGDVDFFTGVPRLGKKNAQKIIIELKGKLDLNAEIGDSDGFGKKNNEVITALQHFGFTAKEAQEAIRNIQKDGQTAEEKIKLALKYLGK
ncbi:MAG: Holliday junction branch migration protein RuvA [Candidatus Levyibacteriota bacterium]|nr:MAG: Holliday junction branch migration protein RuvA [Candidatus Levybacteria bacterium]